MLFPKEKSSEVNTMEIKFGAKSYIQLKMTKPEIPFSFKLSYIPTLSAKRIATQEYEVSSDTTIVIELETNMPQEHNFTINDIKIPVFISLNDTIKVYLNNTSKEITYAGTNQEINRFLYSTNLERQDLIYEAMNIHGGKYNVSINDQYARLDSIAELLEGILDCSAKILPKWYVSLESHRIEFRIAWFKLSAPSYQNFKSPERKLIPNDHNFAFLQKLDFSSPFNKYLGEFYIFMNFYSQYLAYGNDYVISDKIKPFFTEDSLANKTFEVFENENIPEDNLWAYCLDKVVSDLYSAKERGITRMAYLTEKYGNDDAGVKYLAQIKAALAPKMLEKGDKAPGFYLQDLEGEIHSLEDQKGKIILLNFYTRGCVACFKEVPYEKQLQQKYESELRIINICHTKSEEEFKKAVDRFGLEELNLYTPDNWFKKLQDSYMIGGYPHYVLIDKAGRIIKNSTFKPSNSKLEELIINEINTGS